MTDSTDLARNDPGAAVQAMTVAEMATLTAGSDVWTVPGIARLGLPPLRMTDGPNGARGATFGGNATRAVCVPCGSALGATFDPDLLHDIGHLLGTEARQKRSRVLLAPTINMPRSPLFGRSFECYSDDPYLAGSLAAAFVVGAQEAGVATTPKHFIGNETEFERHTINSLIDERTLREVYLVPFEWAIRRGGSLGVMTAYNRLNGSWCSMDGGLLDGILRDQWGFEGFVVSDWFAAGETVASLEAGLDVQMPGPDRFFGAPVAQAIDDGETETGSQKLQAIARRRLLLHHRLDAWTDDTDQPETGDETPEARALAHRAATESMVLLKNTGGVLPLNAGIGSVALIGPNADVAHIMGGGSAQLAAHRRPTLADALGHRLGDRLTVEPGCVIDRLAPPMRPVDGFVTEFFANNDWSGAAVATSTLRTGRAIWAGEPADGLGVDPFTARLTGSLKITETGTHTFTMIQAGLARVRIDGVVVLDGITKPPPKGDAFFGMGSEEIATEIEFAAGTTVTVEVELAATEGTMIRGFALGHRRPVPVDLVERATHAAGRADAAIVMVGTSHEWETEGEDRATLALPGAQAELIEAVAEVNERTIVVVNAGAPVDMSWADRVPGVMLCWLGGQEMAPAIADVLFGDAEPAGRLPVSIPRAIEHGPAFGTYPGEGNESRYAEGLLSGWRWYDTRNIDVAWPFGHGGSYTSFEWGTCVLNQVADNVSITVPVINTGDRAGSDVVQVYAVPPVDGPLGPRAQLAGYAKVRLDPGQSNSANITLNPRTFAHWSPEQFDHRAAFAAMHTEQGGTEVEPVAEPGWYTTPGEWTLEISRSITDVVEHVAVSIPARLGPLTGDDQLP